MIFKYIEQKIKSENISRNHVSYIYSHSYIPVTAIIFKIHFYLGDNCFKMLCWFLLYKHESALSIHISSPSGTSLPPHPYLTPLGCHKALLHFLLILLFSPASPLKRIACRVPWWSSELGHQASNWRHKISPWSGN